MKALNLRRTQKNCFESEKLWHKFETFKGDNNRKRTHDFLMFLTTLHVVSNRVIWQHSLWPEVRAWIYVRTLVMFDFLSLKMYESIIKFLTVFGKSRRIYSKYSPRLLLCFEIWRFNYFLSYLNAVYWVIVVIINYALSLFFFKQDKSGRYLFAQHFIIRWHFISLFCRYYQLTWLFVKLFNFCFSTAFIFHSNESRLSLVSINLVGELLKR